MANRYFNILLGIIILIFIMVSAAISRNNPSLDLPNVLFITIDTLRSDYLGCYGNNKIKTPNIDSLAKQGVMFKNVISPVPLTLPSHTSIFTSTYPQFHKVIDNGGYRLAGSKITLAEVMQDSGYHTAAFVSSMVLDSKFGLDQGFQTYDDKMEKKTTKKLIKLMDEERTADKVTEAALNWLKGNKDKKFFLWVHYYDPHTVYNPPSPYKEIYKDNPYAGEIAFTDEYIGKLLSALKELKLENKTLIVLTSDHGEGLGEHGENGHGIFLYETTLKVPLIFVYPGVIPQGKLIEERVRLIDIMPTILDFLSLKKNKAIQGTSLAGLIKGTQKALNLPAYSESDYAKLHYNWSRFQALYSGEWKYIKSQAQELYNLNNDPLELSDLADYKRDVVKNLDKKLEGLLKKTSAPETKEAKIVIDEQTRLKLESLGYVQGTLTAAAGEPLTLEKIKIMQKIALADKTANEGRVDEAIKLFNEIIKTDPNNIEAYLHLAQCYKELEKYDEAIKYFRKAASFRADVAETHDGLGNVYKNMGRVDEAFKEFEIALALDPDNPAIINNLGWCYQQKLEIDKALEYYQKALEIDSSLATTHANMAICYRLKGQIDKAINEARTAIELEPELAFAYGELCASLATKGDLEGAIPHCRKAIELDPEGIDGYVNLGVCLERKGQYDEALKNYLKALEINPRHALIYCNIANVYIQKKEFVKAQMSLKKALEIDPNNRKAIQILKLISGSRKDEDSNLRGGEDEAKF